MNHETYVQLLRALCHAGAFSAIAFAAVGSGLGTGAASSATIGAWKRAFGQNKPPSFLMLAYAGAPLSQTIYGMIIMFFTMNRISAATDDLILHNYPMILAIGIFGGAAMGFSAWAQGIAGAAACDAYGETGKGFVNYLMVLGIVETVAIFVMAFAIVMLGTVK